MTTPLHLILLAGGKGSRAVTDDNVPKQFRTTGQGPLFAVSLREFLKPAAGRAWHLASVTVTAATDWHEMVATELATGTLPWHLAEPGESRTISTWNAISTLVGTVAPGPDDLVAVHDAARPFASVALLDALAEGALASGGAVPGVPVPDTIVMSTGGPATYLRRESLVAVQTPQVFRWVGFEAAHRWAHEQDRDFTDDGGLLADQGQPPIVVPGEPDNWKVTSAADWERAADLLG